MRAVFFSQVGLAGMACVSKLREDGAAKRGRETRSEIKRKRRGERTTKRLPVMVGGGKGEGGGWRKEEADLDAAPVHFEFGIRELVMNNAGAPRARPQPTGWRSNPRRSNGGSG